MDNSEVIEKIKKAIRLANRTNSEGERDTAMRLAKRLADNNGISIDSINAYDQSGEAIVECDNKIYHRDTVAMVYVCYILRKHFGVVVINTTRKHCNKVRYTYVGCKMNIEIARYVFDILMRESQKAYREARKSKMFKINKMRKDDFGDFSEDEWESVEKSLKLKRRSFMNGFFYSIDMTLTRCPLRNDLEQAEIERKKAEEKFDEYKKSNRVDDRHFNTKVDAASSMQGMEAGKNVYLNRPCGSDGRSTAQLGRMFLLGNN